MDRRKFIVSTAAATGGLWVAPKVATAQGGDPSSYLFGNCTGTAWDIMLTLPGGNTLGPLNQTTQDVDDGDPQCISDAVLATPGGVVLVNLGVDCVDNVFPGPSPGGDHACSTRAFVDDVIIDLGAIINIIDFGLLDQTIANTINSLNLVLEGTLEAAATATCNGFATDGHVVLAGLGDPNNPLIDIDTSEEQVLPINVLAPLVSIELAVNEETIAPPVATREALRLTITAVGQTIELIIAHAEADIHNCPQP